MIIFYMGHNDYNNPYTLVINEHYDFFKLFLYVSYLFSSQQFNFLDQEHVFHSKEYPAFQWFATYNRPKILELLQAIKLYNASQKDNDYFMKYNELILSHFKKNIRDIISVLNYWDMPVIFVTPVGNFRAKPYGDIKEVTAYYNLGIEAANYNESISYLVKAKDAEVFTGDLRAKSALLNFLRSIEPKKVYVFDLEKKLMENKFGFNNSDFLDYFHLNDRSHQLIAQYLYEFICFSPRIAKDLRG